MLKELKNVGFGDLMMTKHFHICDNCDVYNESYKKFKTEQDDILNLYDLDYDYINSIMTIYVDTDDMYIPINIEVEVF